MADKKLSLPETGPEEIARPPSQPILIPRIITIVFPWTSPSLAPVVVLCSGFQVTCQFR